MTFAVPTIDLSPYLVPGADAATSPDCARVAAAIDRACREVGFLQLVGHGISDETLTGLADALDTFFGLGLEQKKAYRREPGANRGYAPPRSESLSNSLGLTPASMMNDFYEAFTVGSEPGWYPGHDLPETSYAHNSWPDVAPGFRAAVEAYLVEVTAVSRVLLRACSDGLGLPPGHFDSLVDHSIDALKMNNYALPEGEIELDGDLTGMGAHTDFGILTLLWADQVAGLQVLDDGGAWHDVMPADGALLVNLGDLMARWTNQRWMSTVHRVKPPVIDGAIRRRRSAAFFHDGNIDAVIETLPTCIGPDGAHDEPITVRDHLRAKLAGSRAGVANSAAGQEAQRVLAAGGR